MSDLISRSALMEEIESLTVHITGFRGGKSILSEMMEEYKKSVLKTINETPTAYNVDKVIAELEDLDGIEFSVRFIPVNSEIVIPRENAIPREKTIEIVRKGGV